MRHPHRGAVQVAAALALATLAAVAAAAELPYAESFPGPDGSAWPPPWSPGTSHVTVADQQGGRARLNGDAGFVSRMLMPGFVETDVEVLVTFEFADVVHQGIGFYVRQNGGTLQEYLPHGQGYAMFLKGAWAWPEDLGLWREIDGVETQFATGYDPVAGGLQDFTRYRLRYRVTQQDASTTRLQARVWAGASAEPAAWTIDATDSRAELQGTAGSFAIDIYNHLGAAPVYLDDIEIRRFPDPTGVPPGPPAAGRLSLGAPRPHPLRGAGTCDLLLAAPADVALALHDVAGRIVARPFAGWLPAGTHAIRLDAAARLAPGLYVLEASAGAERATRRIVIAR